MELEGSSVWDILNCRFEGEDEFQAWYIIFPLNKSLLEFLRHKSALK